MMVRRFPVEPLQSLIRARAWELRGPRDDDHGMRTLARHMAFRYGTDVTSEWRLLQRIAFGHVRWVVEATADRIAIGLDTHPALVWPTEWLCGVTDTKEAA